MSQLTAKVPVGFRFHPTDEELVGYYLPKKVGAMKIDLDLIRDLDLYKLEPWDLQELCKIQADSNEKQTDYYFFSRKDKKYPTGNRANRATTKGFWKATGRDKPIHTKLQTLIGMRKTLVFYQGRAPHGVKTDWIMHEFRLDDGPGRPAHEDGGWVVCRVFKKNKNLKLKLQERALSYEEQMGLLPEPLGSPDILSHNGGQMHLQRFAFPEQQKQFSCVKREIINLDEYCSPGSTLHHTNYNNFHGPTSEQMRSYLTRTLSTKRPEELHHPFYVGGGGLSYDQGDEGTSLGTSGSEVDGDVDYNDDATISGLENVDWSALLQEPVTTATTTAATTTTMTKSAAIEPSVGGDVTVLLQLKRQNSDMFSSMDLWNYSQIAQQL